MFHHKSYLLFTILSSLILSAANASIIICPHPTQALADGEIPSPWLLSPLSTTFPQAGDQSAFNKANIL